MASATTSDYLYTNQMNFLLHNTAWTAVPTIYVALFNTVPALDGTGGAEVSTTGTGYGRIGVAAGGWNGPTGANLEYSNAADIQYGTPTANWNTIVGAGLYDSDTGGSNNLLFVAYLTTQKVVNNGDGAPKILAGQLRITRATC